MRRLIWGCLLGLIVAGTAFADPQQDYQAAVSALSKGNDRAAVESLTSLKSQGFDSFELNYNLGLANQRLNRKGAARAAYERARELNSWDRDTQRNLDKVRASLQDSEPDGSTLRDLCTWVSEPALWAAFTLSHLVLVLGLWRYRSNPSDRLLWLIAGTACVCISLLTIFAMRKNLNERAVILPEATVLKNGPGREFTDSLAVHAGTLVEVIRRDGDWTEVEALSNVRAWIPEADLARLQAPKQ
jgi:hypothetical protein